MEGDSFIYLNINFVDRLFDRKLTIHNLVSRWLSGKFIQGDHGSGANRLDYAFDRTNTIIGPLRETNISPMPDFDINFNKSFKEICESAATDILNEGNPVDIFWSGGVDSTAIVVSFLNVCKDLSQISIVFDKEGIDEYPLFYKKYVKNITQEPISTPIYDNINLKENIVVTGDPAGMLVQNSRYGHASVLSQNLKRLGFEDSDFKVIPWQEVFNADISTFGNPMYDEYFIEHITPQVENAPFKIETIADLHWWLAFSMKWQGENMLLIKFFKELNYKDMQNLKPFYSTNEFQKWAMWNYDTNLRKVLPQTYKIDFKEVIYEFTKDEDYYINKKKGHSGWRGNDPATRKQRRQAYMNLNERIWARDNQHNIFTADSLLSSTHKEDILNRYRNPDYVL